VLAEETADPGRFNAEHQGHWGRLEALKGDVVTGTNFHVVSPEGLANVNRRNKPETRRSFR